MAVNPNDMDQVARIAAKQMGDAPAPAPQAAAPAPKPKPQEAPPTAQEKASEAGSPETEGDKAAQDPVVYKVNIGGSERDVTPQQIAGTFERYRDLNYKQAQMNPVIELAEKMMKAGNATPEQVAKFMTSAAQAMTKNPQMGNTRPKQEGVAAPKQPTGSQDYSVRMADELKKYEDENAISLPPGYKEGMDRIQRMEGRLEEMMVQNQKVMQAASQSAQVGAQMAGKSAQDHAEVIRQATSNNLDTAQRQYNLPDSDASLFMQFAGERGYTAEDFADKTLTMKVMEDFANMKNSPELGRLQELDRRRQAFMTAQNQGAGAAPASNQEITDLQRLGAMAASQAIQKGQIGRG